MKLLSTTLILIAVVGLLVYTNPTLDEYSNYMRQQIVHEANDQDQESRSLAVALGGIASYFISNATTRENYVVFSVFKTELGPKRKRCIGLLGNFFGCGDSSTRAQGNEQ